MSVRARALFFASLALVIGPLALPGRATTPIAPEAAAPALEPVQVHHEPHPATHGARSWLPDRPADRDADAPFASGQSLSEPLSPVEFPAAGPAGFGPSADPLLLLPPSRAPPALS